MKCLPVSLWLSVMSQICHCCQNLSSDLFVMESTPFNENDLTPHTLQSHISKLTTSDLAHNELLYITNIAAQSLTSIRWSLTEESAPLSGGWLMLTSDYSSTTYQSRAAGCEVVRWCLVWEKFSPTTDCEHITSHTKNTELVKQYHTLYTLHRQIDSFTGQCISSKLRICFSPCILRWLVLISLLISN